MAETNHNRTPSGVDRRRSRATTSSSIRSSMPDEDDDYDLAAMGISDGFRPSTNIPTTNPRMSSSASHRERRSTPPPRPSSTTKPRALDNFSLRHDGAMGIPSRSAAVASSSVSGMVTRSSSVSTDLPVIRAESPYQGPAGPSHPYHMYPQNTRMARTASISTTSTFQAPAERHYGGPLRPTHPYGMYAQNTIPEPESVQGSIQPSHIPVGFPGLEGEYQRRLGPDGEDAADIIGPLGHTEQLPPYTKYPDEAFVRKASPAAPQLSGAGGIGLATRDPEFASREDLNSPLSRQSNRSVTSDSDHHINVAASGVSEKRPDKKWKILARRKVCGIVPVWALVLVGLVLLGFILIMGTVFGILSHQRKQASSRNNPDYGAPGTVYATVTTTYDAQSLSAVPTGIPDLPTGTFILPIATPTFSPQTCIDDSSLSSAWSCAIPPSSIEMVVSPLPDSDSDTQCNEITIVSNAIPMSYFYGSQPPIILPHRVLSLVNDTQQSQFGPAWYFEIAYDKLVIVPENLLSVPSNNKRANEVHRRHYKGFNRKAIAQTGDRPWFCYWNNTLLETFIYVNRTSGSGAQEAAESSSVALSSMRKYPSAYHSASPTAMVSEPAAMTTSATASAATTSEVPTILQGYPKIIKVEERRVPLDSFSIAPYCVQMEIQEDGSAQDAYDDNGHEIVIYLDETEPSLFPPKTKRGPSDDMSDANKGLVDRNVPNQCQCIWLSS